MIRPFAAGALLLALVGAAAAPPAAAAPLAPTAVDLGGAPGYVRSDAGSPLAGVQLFVRAGLDRQSGSQNGLAALTAEAVLRTPVDGVALVEAIAARGGSLGYAVAPRYVRFHLQAAPEALAGLAPLLARALAAPATDPATLAAARTALGERIAEDERNPVLAGLGMVRASFYRGGPGQPPLGTPGALTAYGAPDVRGFHDRWYVRGSAYLAEVGRTGPGSDAAARALVAALPAGSAAPAPALATRPFVKEPRRLVTRRDIGSPYVVLGFAAPALGARDFAPALVVRALLGEVLQRAGATTLPPQRRGIGTIYGYDVAPAQFALWINGAQIEPGTGLGTLAAVVKTAGQKPLAPAVLARYKETARGTWRLEAVTLEDRAWAIGNAVAQGVDPAALDAIPAAIDAVSAADVQRVAKRWFQQFDVALVLPRAGGG
ncbi:MAG: zinc protease [Candidatus Eremiobacteraeota bacterium]|nr:zinc protease [Candidatus Eremiobacteraeota bacterium]